MSLPTDNNYTIDVDSTSTISLGPLYTNSSWNGTWSTGGGNYSITATPPGTMNISNSGKIECSGENADLILNGKSVKNTLEAIEQRLAILQPNPELESEWEELKDLGQRYRTLEAEIKEKMKVWEILKKENNNGPT